MGPAIALPTRGGFGETPRRPIGWGMRGPGSTPGPFAGCLPKRSTSWAATPATSSSDGAAPRLLRHFLTVSVTVTVTSFVTVTGLVTVTTWAAHAP